jgi:hypothetical protein
MGVPLPTDFVRVEDRPVCTSPPVFTLIFPASPGMNDTTPATTHTATHTTLDGDLVRNAALSSHLSGTNQHSSRSTRIEPIRTFFGQHLGEKLRDQPPVSEAPVLRRTHHFHPKPLKIFFEIEIGLSATSQ